ncbi:sensor histidine kinase [Dongia sedimenti]|uniref:histidine kinase n=1 Tax=Dongia sedimenti TaxID=3064282 RepID=A0ABU0YPV3_9PROT|nr:histidine kinase [Rhodospirillaceae bacterium R-7]
MAWRRDLKVRLTLRIVGVAAFCFAAAAAYVLFEADRSMRSRLDRMTEVAAKDLALQHGKRAWIKDPAPFFPDLEVLATGVLAPGLCLGYRDAGGAILQSFCSGSQDDDPPALFAFVYTALFDPGRESARSVVFQGRTVGAAIAWGVPLALTAQAWHEVAHLLAIMILTLLLLCVLVYAALARALRPTQAIHAGLERIAANDLSARLPAFDLAELSPIRDVFNHLAENLQASLAERTALTRRLIDLQEDERRHLARELHDEFGQNLTAIRALAMAARETAARDCPALLPECGGIARITADMMESLRGALFRLRPPDVEELGLAASLEGLIAGWNGRSRDRTRFELRLEGNPDALPPAFGTSLYRIAQEALTNAAKHAAATRVTLRLSVDAAGEIQLTVDDDGGAGDNVPAGGAGMGLLGMRERVATLGGRMSFETTARSGSVLRVAIPFDPVRAA